MDGVFNIARGKVHHYATLPVTNDAFVVVLLRVAQADELLVDHDTLASVLGANTEANFTDYARKIVSTVTITVDDSGDLVRVAIADQTFVGAGGAINNTVVKTLICYDNDTTTGTDTNIVPLLHYDTVFTTDNNDVTLQFNASGIWQSGS